MKACSKAGGLNPQAPEYIPIYNNNNYPYNYLFFPPQTLITPYNFHHTNYYQQTTAPPPPPTAASLTTSVHHLRPRNEEMIHSHDQRPRFGDACNKNMSFMNNSSRRFGDKMGNYHKLGRERIGNNKKYGGENGRCRVVQSCVKHNTRPKSLLPLTHNGDQEDVTTVMIRNIPNKLTRWGLMKLLDKHCMLMNNEECGDNNVSAYDFVYLPMDFKTGVNKGYAFVNFTNKKGVEKFHNVFQHKTWNEFTTPKITEIVCAKIQGKEELVKHFGSTIFICRHDAYLPLCFSPARDGSGNEVKERIVGKRRHK